MRRYYLVVLFALMSWTQAQQVSEPVTTEAENVMPPATDTVNDDAVVSLPVVEENVALENIEMELVARAIYQCMDHGRAVFADEENRSKYSQCVQIRAAQYQQVKGSGATHNGAAHSPCSGAVVYQGSTYVFNDQEPCPIPDTVFQSRKPIEANPEYYAQPTP